MKKLLLPVICLIASLLSAGTSFAQSFVVSGAGNPICAGTADTFRTTYPGTTTTFQWAVNSTATGTDSIFITSGLLNGDTVHCTINTGSGTLSDSIVMVVNTAPPASGAIFGSWAVCTGDSTQLSDTVTGGIWTSLNATASVTATAYVTGIAAGTDTLVYTVTNACGSNHSDFVIHVDTPLAALVPLTVSGSPINCVGTTVQLNETVPGGLWTSSNTLKATVNDTGLVSLLTNGGDTIKYTLANSCGSHTVWHFIDIHPLPQVGPITADTAVCAGSTVTLHNSVAGGIWSSTNTFFATINATGTVSGLVTGSTIIAYTVINACGTVSDSINFLIDGPVQPIIGSDVLCQFTLGVFVDPISGGTWSIDNPLAAIAIPTTPGAFFGLLPGNANIIYTVVNACGTTTASFPITVSACPSEVQAVAATQEQVSVFPNPSSGTFSLLITSANNGPVTATVTNMMGEKVKDFTLTANHETELTLDAAAGVYFLTAATTTGQYTTRIVVTK